MDLRQLRYFVAAAESGGISRAAKRCRVSQPSLSQQILRLEDDLGVPLFDRLGRGVALTDAGAALLPRARQILARVHAIESDLRADLDEGRGRISIGAIPTMAPYLVPALVADLRAEHPGCELLVREDLTENLIEAVADNDLDLAIVSTPIDHEQIELEVVGTEPFLVVAPTQHPACAQDEIALPDLRAEPVVTLDEMHCLGRQITDFCKAKRVGANVACRMTQIDTLLEFVRVGLGVSIVPEMVAARDDNPGRAYLRFKRNTPTRDIALAFRKGRTRSRLARRFADLLTSRIAEGVNPRPPAA